MSEPFAKLSLWAPVRRDGLRVDEVEPVGLIRFRLGLGAGDLIDIVERRTSIALPTTPNTIWRSDDQFAVWLSPQDWLIQAADPDAVVADLQSTCKDVSCHAARVDDAYVVYTIVGANARPFLSHGCSLDLHPRTFGATDSARSLVSGVPSLIVRAPIADGFSVHLGAEFKGHMRRWIQVSAEGY